LETVDLASIR